MTSRGSSPLTRGKLSNGLRSPSRPRLIPAHAGKTRGSVISRASTPAHPRSRGENPLISSKKHPFGGSSPLTRGKRNHYRPTLRDRRLIPAHAGKTAPPSGARVSEPAHPRSRGENRSSSLDSRSEAGSSPLTRGKRGELLEARRGGRLIPAHAGKTRSEAGQRWARRAHPRSRGENHRVLPRLPSALGSSPLTRGKQCAHGMEHLWMGLIPAHAGKTNWVNRV